MNLLRSIQIHFPDPLFERARSEHGHGVRDGNAIVRGRVHLGEFSQRRRYLFDDGWFLGFLEFQHGLLDVLTSAQCRLHHGRLRDAERYADDEDRDHERKEDHYFSIAHHGSEEATSVFYTTVRRKKGCWSLT